MRAIEGVMVVVSRATVAFCAAMAIVACASTMQTWDVEPSGFLKDYTQLRKGREGEAQMIYINMNVDPAIYDKVIIDPITIWNRPDTSLSDVPKQDLQRLADSLDAKLRNSLEVDYEIVDQPGDGVMRLRVAITEAQASAVVADTVSSLPGVRVVSTIAALGTDIHSFVGRARIECEILDSLSGQRIMAAVAERVGAKTLKGSSNTWDDVEEAYSYWSVRLRERLRELGGTKGVQRMTVEGMRP